MLGINIFWYAVDFYALLSEHISVQIYYFIKSSSFGLGYVFLGIGYLGYKNIWSNIPQIIGALGVVAGILIFSGIGIFFGLIPSTFLELGQLVLMIWIINLVFKVSS